ncbi:hypothetical protein ACH5RR_023194 [Cinchona calisaya]|uniref:Uncharacterized protein n=1 Tax=Cinchona calisaya TaxID=153742 RepID=A0ABD2ZD46_9GENT
MEETRGHNTIDCPKDLKAKEKPKATDHSQQKGNVDESKGKKIVENIGKKVTQVKQVHQHKEIQPKVSNSVLPEVLPDGSGNKEDLGGRNPNKHSKTQGQKNNNAPTFLNTQILNVKEGDIFGVEIEVVSFNPFSILNIEASETFKEEDELSTYHASQESRDKIDLIVGKSTKELLAYFSKMDNPNANTAT